MPDQRSLTILRDNVTEGGCIEFSWVPTGKRIPIVLPAGQRQGTSVVTTDEATNVQVYVLTQGRKSLASWQFPAVGKKQLVSASIAVREAQNVVDAVAFYEDGSHEAFSRKLENEHRMCPTDPGAVTRG
jgi:hypothetical protein